ncbi:hypothetical protein K505DRAFT_418315 [Melanomma pulvis-pyrius CBS 109.77]|uniref:Uncharacterized protein n=1 Tax=Melanomma pulvis-pyrius CBS 109.77 TaxID=1314802 RepID=A0A6A6X9P2_9PLEO|nr:hypothetical protein K505DRAFT_418315 [Melanomma pulvis-pyrius CBS 109.77]
MQDSDPNQLPMLVNSTSNVAHCNDITIQDSDPNQVLIRLQRDHDQLQARYSALQEKYNNTVANHDAQIKAKQSTIDNIHRDRRRVVTQATEYRLGEQAEKDYHKVKRENASLKAEHLGNGSAFNVLSDVTAQYQGQLLHEQRARRLAEDDRKTAYDSVDASHVDQFMLIHQVSELQDQVASLEKDNQNLQKLLEGEKHGVKKEVSEPKTDFHADQDNDASVAHGASVNPSPSLAPQSHCLHSAAGLRPKAKSQRCLRFTQREC